jgi:biopolymer transport protein ExbB/TolQ
VALAVGLALSFTAIGMFIAIVRHQMHCDSLRRCLVEVRAHRYG